MQKETRSSSISCPKRAEALVTNDDQDCAYKKRLITSLLDAYNGEALESARV